MEYTMRWFGPKDPVTLEEIRQTGATGIVTALHDIPAGEVWPVAAIAERKRLIEDAGLEWSVVESVPVADAVKSGTAGAADGIAAWNQTLVNLSGCGLFTVCYNFMPVIDWTRTDLSFELPDGTWALRFDSDAFAAFDLYIVKRAAAKREYSTEQIDRAHRYMDSLDDESRAKLTQAIIAGLPGAEEHYEIDTLKARLDLYREVGPDELRRNLSIFLDRVLPVAQRFGVTLAIHPDDPPRPLLGLPRIVSTEADVERLLNLSQSPSHALTFCVGSFGVHPDNDVPGMVRRFADRIAFLHLRSTRREDDPLSFHEAGHIDGDVNMVDIIHAVGAEEERRRNLGEPEIPMRPDHGPQMLSDQNTAGNPGYSLIGRMKGLAELRGVERAVKEQSSSTPALSLHTAGHKPTVPDIDPALAAST